MSDYIPSVIFELLFIMENPTTADEQEKVKQWLQSLVLSRYFPNFIKNGYDTMLVCAHIDHVDLDCLEVTLPGHRYNTK